MNYRKLLIVGHIILIMFIGTRALFASNGESLATVHIGKAEADRHSINLDTFNLNITLNVISEHRESIEFVLIADFDTTFKEPISFITTPDTLARFEKFTVGSLYYIKTYAVKKGTSTIVSNEEIIKYSLAKVSMGGELESTQFFSYPIFRGLHWAGRLFKIDSFEKTNLFRVYDGATVFGKVAFEIIAFFFYFGILIWLFKIWITLRTVRIFPFERRFEFILKKAGKRKRYEIAEINDVIQMVRRGIKRYGFKDDPTKLCRLIVNRLTPRHFRGWNINRIYKYFDKIAFWLRRIWLAMTRNLRKLRPYKYRLDNLSSNILLESALAEMKKGSPTEKEIRDAMADRAAADIDRLRKTSGLDLIWGLAVTLPLLGLFGTVTGLSDSFSQLPGSDGGVDIISDLGKGIYEALWTTIFGLMFGIMFMMVYYYYDYKLNRIYHTWEHFYIDFISIFILKMDIRLDEIGPECRKLMSENKEGKNVQPDKPGEDDSGEADEELKTKPKKKREIVEEDAADLDDEFDQEESEEENKEEDEDEDEEEDDI